MKNLDLYLEYIDFMSEQDIPPEPTTQSPYNLGYDLASGLPGKLAIAGTAGLIGAKLLKRLRDRVRSGA